MQFEFNPAKARKLAEKLEKDNVLITFQINKKVRAEAVRKTANLSDYLRRCVQKLVESKIEKRINRLYDEVINEALAEETENDGGKE